MILQTWVWVLLIALSSTQLCKISSAEENSTQFSAHGIEKKSTANLKIIELRRQKRSSGPADFMTYYKDSRYSLLDIIHQMNKTMFPPGLETLSICQKRDSFSCKAIGWKKRCDDHLERQKQLSCYCDSFCEQVGDCCWDYYHECKTNTTLTLVKNSTSQRKPCEMVKGNEGYTLVNTCAFNFTDTSIIRQCRQSENRNNFDLFKIAPVFERVKKINYKNFYCAVCNYATNIRFWRIEAKCIGASSSRFNATTLMSKIKEGQCFWKFKPSSEQLKSTAHCIPMTEDDQNCLKRSFRKGSVAETVQKLCRSFAFEVCFSSTRKNPYCVLCLSGTHIQFPECSCQGTAPGVPDLSVMFDFESTARYTAWKLNQEEEGESEPVVVEYTKCKTGQVYDHFSQMCRDLYRKPALEQRRNSTSNITMAINSSSVSNNFSCAMHMILLNKTEIVMLQNRSILVLPHKRTYEPAQYTIQRDTVILCIKFDNISKRVIDVERENITSSFAKNLSVLQIITYIGGGLSIVSLIVLLVIYSCIKELRNIPGKIIMNLAVALLGYQALFFLTGQTHLKHFCIVVAVFLHYFFLAMFSWTSVFAFDVTATFTTKGSIRHSKSGRTKKLLIYCCHGWGSPLLVVLPCAILDQTQVINIGYGSEQICWISQKSALFFCVGIPVGLVLIFNLLAMIITMAAIYRVRKVSRCLQKTNERTLLPLLCVKFTVILGLPWFLGLIATASRATAFLWYPYVIINSSQGLLLCLAQILNRTMAKLCFPNRKDSKRATGRGLCKDKAVSQETIGTIDTRF